MSRNAVHSVSGLCSIVGEEERMDDPDRDRAGIVESARVEADGAAAAAGERGRGVVAINADDWGCDAHTTNRILECVQGGVVSSVSAMVFMEDSERAADLARRHNVDAGLHLNFTTPFTAQSCPARLVEHQGRCARFLRAHRLAPMLFHPGLAASFHSVVQAQMDEFERIFGHSANRVDGHHHMHLCQNIQLAKLLPDGIMVRRNFSFIRGEKSFLNRAYRNRQDRVLARRHSITDLFFALRPLHPVSRLEEIFALAGRYAIEVETHPVHAEEFRFLMDGGLKRAMGEAEVAQGYFPRAGSAASNQEVRP